MYIGEHNLYDVINGAALGTLFGTLLWFFVLTRPEIAGRTIPEPGADQGR